MPDLTGKKVAILVADGFEQVEMTGPREALNGAGAETKIVSPKDDQVEGWNHYDKGDKFPVDVRLSDADADDFDALLLPGGVANPDQLRIKPEAVEFVRSFVDSGKPVAVICHGPWTLIEADVVRGERLPRCRAVVPALSTPVRTGSIRNASSTTASSRVVSRLTFPHSTKRCSRNLPKAPTTAAVRSRDS